ncbi:heavy metal-binding domain-containing protein [uncultured Lacinutrix sp.]|uniref:YbjQ family protein n=1 Tax=uncultured Lacinutrix sp. TaxID=574032 RepID=UPI002615D7A4|nr:heavy metal-binding domain-containing protein [uncultured Lacinutrix sp.]
MVLTTTNNIEGFRIIEYKGLVTGLAINEQKLAAGFSVTKYYKAVKESIAIVKEEAFQDLAVNAKKLNANAVVGVKVELELTASNYAIVSVTGTAVSVATDK